jgi:glycosyltransferase involved in cell wall biosynthesis
VGVIAPQLIAWRRDPTAQLAEWVARPRDDDSHGGRTLRMVIPAPPLRTVRRGCFHWSARRLAKRYISQYGRPDLIHAHCAVWGGVAGQELAGELNVPLAVTEHSEAVHRGILTAPDRADAVATYIVADGLAAVSASLAMSMQTLSGRSDIQVVPNAIDTDYFSPSAERRRRGRILSIGNLVAVKGFDLLLRAFAALPEPANTLAIGGDGPELGRLQELAHDLGVASRVSWLGVLSREQVRKEMRQAALFVLASRSETFGVVLLEAAATGLPFVATASGGPDSFVVPELGSLCPVDSVAGLASEIAEGLARREELPPAAMHAHVSDRFGPVATARRLIAFYEAAMAMRRTPFDIHSGS